LASFLELTNISKRFGGVQALADVSLTLEAGEVHCQKEKKKNNE